MTNNTTVTVVIVIVVIVILQRFEPRIIFVPGRNNGTTSSDPDPDATLLSYPRFSQDVVESQAPTLGSYLSTRRWATAI